MHNLYTTNPQGYTHNEKGAHNGGLPMFVQKSYIETIYRGIGNWRGQQLPLDLPPGPDELQFPVKK